MCHDTVFFRIVVPLLSCLLMAGLFLCSPAHSRAKKKNLVYFPNTAYELNVYKIYGKFPGKTVMLIGGIQGNEPGGFLSADLYADMMLEKGNLIVVPRANFYSILMNHRGVHGDMNRKFAHDEATDSMEDKIVNILKGLIKESDYLLNLHDGSGYYHPEYINKWRNPLRFGQSIIADCDTYMIPGTDRTVPLRDIAVKVIEQVNPHIKKDLYKFHFNNTRTAAPESRHKEQRKSATYYALTKHHIPAFGVETSKFLPSIDLKVRFHNLVINAFMKQFGIVPQYPGFNHEKPVLKYLVVSVNGQTPIVVKGDQQIEISEGDRLHVSHIEANYERGLSLDILGYGDLNDFRRDFVITRNTAVLVRKYHQKFVEIPVLMSRKSSRKAVFTGAKGKIQHFLIQAKGHRLLVSNGGTLDLVKGDHMMLLDVLSSGPLPSDLKVNFKGFVGNWKNNTGEDRGYDIDTGKALMRRYSLKKKGNIFPVIATSGEETYGRFLVRLKKTQVRYVIFEINGETHRVVAGGKHLHLAPEDRFRVLDIRTNLHDGPGVHVILMGHRLQKGEPYTVSGLLNGSKRRAPYEAAIMKGALKLGKILVTLR